MNDKYYKIEKKKIHVVHPLLIGHGFKDLIRCLEAQPRLVAFPIQLMMEFIIYIHILTFKL
jgi:hypothetical protein